MAAILLNRVVIPSFTKIAMVPVGHVTSTLQNFTRPKLIGAERPRGARLRRGAAAYGVAFPALQTPILAQKIAGAPRAQPHLSRRAPRAALPAGALRARPQKSTVIRLPSDTKFCYVGGSGSSPQGSAPRVISGGKL